SICSHFPRRPFFSRTLHALLLGALTVGAATVSSNARADDPPIPGADALQSATDPGDAQLLEAVEASTVTAGRNHAGLNVTAEGALTYSISIEVPAGRGGLQPRLALVYSSMAGNGIAGMGWSLTGVPVIQRMRGNIGNEFDDEETYAVNWGSWGVS